MINFLRCSSPGTVPAMSPAKRPSGRVCSPPRALRAHKNRRPIGRRTERERGETSWSTRQGGKIWREAKPNAREEWRVSDRGNFSERQVERPGAGFTRSGTCRNGDCRDEPAWKGNGWLSFRIVRHRERRAHRPFRPGTRHPARQRHRRKEDRERPSRSALLASPCRKFVLIVLSV